jgi:multicomponent Na+:H+ antiporter subunit G
MATFAEVLVLLGCLLVAISSIGLHRFDDVFARLHAAGKATSLGFLLIAAGALARDLPARAAGELVLAAGLLLLTTPVGVHMLARAAYRAGDQLAPDTTVDELAPDRSSPASDTLPP